ncbi:MAG: hypothetical protein ACLU9S_06915 [Oscillospiraceae bacterium]
MKNPTRAPTPRRRNLRREIRALADMPWVRGAVRGGQVAASLALILLRSAPPAVCPLPWPWAFGRLEADWTVLPRQGAVVPDIFYSGGQRPAWSLWPGWW